MFHQQQHKGWKLGKRLFKKIVVLWSLQLSPKRGFVVSWNVMYSLPQAWRCACLKQLLLLLLVCFLLVFWEKTCFKLLAGTILIGFELKPCFFLKKEALSYLSKQTLIYKFDCERLGQQSTCCFKEMKTFNRWLSDQPPCHFHCWSNVTF